MSATKEIMKAITTNQLDGSYLLILRLLYVMLLKVVV